MNKYEDANRRMWDKLADVHSRSYDIEGFLAGRSSLDEIQLRELGDLRGRRLLHLQCHIGVDTLSLAREGAVVTGVDFSRKSLEHARRLSTETGIPARFIQSNIYDLEKHLDEEFDVVYTTQGVLGWLKDLRKWARIASRYLRPGGFLYVMEAHPIMGIFDDTKKGALEIIHPYFHQDQPQIWDDHAPDYSDPGYRWEDPTFNWQWSIADIINSIIEAGLTLEFFNEYDKTFDRATPDMERAKNGWWILPGRRTKLPLSFTLRARKKST
jgi:SAM-dependent methyltransferase